MFTLLALVVVLMVHGDYGSTCDEPVGSIYGKAVLDYITGHTTYDELTHTPGMSANMIYYAPGVDLFCATLAQWLHADIFQLRHTVQGLIWAAMFYPVCALGRRLAGRLGAWFSGLALLGMPGLFGQAFNNPKDLPLACASIWLLHVAVAVAARRKPGPMVILPLALAIGLVLCARPGAWFLCAPVALLPLVAWLRAYRITGEARLQVAVRPLAWLMIAGGVGWVLMVLPWPSAWRSPLWHPLDSMRLAAHFKESYAVLFKGQLVQSAHLPWDYMLDYIMLTLPLPILLLAILGHASLWQKVKQSSARTAAVLGTGFVIWFPLAMFLVLRMNVYNGMRHFLFVLPPLAVVAGVAAADGFRYLRPRVPAMVLLPVVVVALLSAVPAMVRLHPYESVYYNMLAGPKATLIERYETDYWFSSYREAAGWINERQAASDAPLRVLYAAQPPFASIFTHYLNDKTQADLLLINDFSTNVIPRPYDYYVASVSYGQAMNFGSAPIAHRIVSDGIILATIRAGPGPGQK